MSARHDHSAAVDPPRTPSGPYCDAALPDPELVDARAGHPRSRRQPAISVVADAPGDEVGREEDLHRQPGRLIGQPAVGGAPGAGSRGGVGRLERLRASDLRVEMPVAEPRVVPVARIRATEEREEDIVGGRVVARPPALDARLAAGAPGLLPV